MDTKIDARVTTDTGRERDSQADTRPQDMALDLSVRVDAGSDATELPALVAKSELVDGVWEFDTNLAPLADDCPTVSDVACDDLDNDLVIDAWEDLLLDFARPLLVFDEDEQAVGDPSAVITHVARVVPVRRRPFTVHIYMTILYDRDYGTCGSLTSHNGDSERVALRLIETVDRTMRVEKTYTAAHENTVTDHSQVFENDDLTLLEYRDMADGPRWVVYPSQNKHATYATVDICENTSPLPCFDEDCQPDGVADVTAFEMLAPVFNAGEPDAQLLSDLTAVGYPGDDAWIDQKFCGGLDRALLCSGSVFSKLTEDPFD